MGNGQATLSPAFQGSPVAQGRGPGRWPETLFVIIIIMATINIAIKMTMVISIKSSEFSISSIMISIF